MNIHNSTILLKTVCFLQVDSGLLEFTKEVQKDSEKGYPIIPIKVGRLSERK